MDFTYVCIIIRGTLNEIKIKFIYGGWPHRTEQKSSHMYVLSF